MKTVYPVVFTQTDEGILVEVPDLAILTEGKDMADAIDMARDAIGLQCIALEDKGKELPVPCKMEDVRPDEMTFAGEGHYYVSFVDVDVSEYRKRADNRMVRRNVTLPNWLNHEAEKAHINVSKVLQEALKEELKEN